MDNSFSTWSKGVHVPMNFRSLRSLGGSLKWQNMANKSVMNKMMQLERERERAVEKQTNKQTHNVGT